MNHNPRIPTVNDLRVKLCYICREEEHYDAPPEDPPRPWTHPCTCTLVAHESCLLRWIQTSQGDSARAPNALKCPQCGTKYELVSHRPRILRLLGLGNGILQRVGRLLTLAGAAGVVAVFASGIYVVLTGYGAWAVKQFIGEEMFSLIVTDDPANWPWTTFINLPSIPLSLIASRFQTPALIPTLVPILLVWPPAPPLVRPSLSPTDLRLPPSSLGFGIGNTGPGTTDALWTWPPTPAVFGFLIVPLVRAAYRRAWAHVQVWALGAQPPGSRVMNAAWDGWPIVIRIRANVVGEDGQQLPQQQQPQQQQEQDGGGAGEGEQAQAQALAAAEQQISISTASLGRRVGGALLLPYISSRMGALLLSLSKHSHTLRRVLGVRPPLGAVGWPYGYGAAQGEEGLGPVSQVRKALGMVWRASWRGSRAWVEADPVWWRNALGLGLFVVAKDCIELLHLWLAKRELESRHVRSRDFAGVDARELDLVPGFPDKRKPMPGAMPVRARSLPRGL